MPDGKMGKNYVPLIWRWVQFCTLKLLGSFLLKVLQGATDSKTSIGTQGCVQGTASKGSQRNVSRLTILNTVLPQKWQPP